MMNVRKAENTIDKILKDSSKTDLSAKISAAVILVSVVLISLAYITDIIFVGQTNFSVGETFFISNFLLQSGNLLSKLIYPLISAGTAALVGNIGSIPAGLLGGMLASEGVTLTSINANITGTSGIFGSILAGIIAGYWGKFINNFLEKKEINKSNLIIVISSSLVITLFAVFALNSISEIINHFASVLAGFAGKTNGLLLSVILGIFMTADSGGPLYLAGYTFGVASISTGNPENMAMVIAAGAIPPLTMGLYTIIYKERVEDYERLIGTVGIAGGVLGLPLSALIFYKNKTYRFILSCVPGGIIASMLSLALKCSSESPAGGLLGFKNSGRPFFFILALLCGALISTILLSFADGYEQENPAKDEISSPEVSKNLSVQI